MGRGSHRPWNTRFSTRRPPTPFDTDCLANNLSDVPIDFGVADIKTAAVDDIAEILAGVGHVSAVERDDLVLGGDLKVEQEEREEEGCLVEPGMILRIQQMWRIGLIDTF